MNMPHSRKPAAIRWIICLLISTCPVSAQPPLAVWQSKDAQSGPPVVVPEKQIGVNLRAPSSGISIKEDGEEGQVLRFDGSQPGALSSEIAITSSDRVKISAKVKLDDNPGWGTILKFSGMELQHQGNRGNIILVGWLEGGPEGASTQEVALPHTLGQWITVEGSIDGNFLRLSVDGAEKEASFEGFYPAKPGTVQAGHAGGRPLRGELAEIKIEDLP